MLPTYLVRACWRRANGLWGRVVDCAVGRGQVSAFWRQILHCAVIWVQFANKTLLVTAFLALSSMRGRLQLSVKGACDCMTCRVLLFSEHKPAVLLITIISWLASRPGIDGNHLMLTGKTPTLSKALTASSHPSDFFVSPFHLCAPAACRPIGAGDWKPTVQ